MSSLLYHAFHAVFFSVIMLGNTSPTDMGCVPDAKNYKEEVVLEVAKEVLPRVFMHGKLYGREDV